METRCDDGAPASSSPERHGHPPFDEWAPLVRSDFESIEHATGIAGEPLREHIEVARDVVETARVHHDGTNARNQTGGRRVARRKCAMGSGSLRSVFNAADR